MLRFCFFLLAGLCIAATARAGEPDQEREYAACLTAAQENPNVGFERALAWQSRNGGDPARHCAAVALIGLGHAGEAAGRLETLAENVARADRKLAAEILAQAGQAWLMEDESERAFAAQSAGLKLDPENVELLIDRSITLATARNYRSTIEDLDRAARLVPGRAEVLILRASAYRMVDDLERARQDIDRALALEPRNPEGLLERGMLRRLAGKADGARADWLQVLALAPDSPAAEAARANLERLDVKKE